MSFHVNFPGSSDEFSDSRGGLETKSRECLNDKGQKKGSEKGSRKRNPSDNRLVVYTSLNSHRPSPTCTGNHQPRYTYERIPLKGNSQDRGGLLLVYDGSETVKRGMVVRICGDELKIQEYPCNKGCLSSTKDQQSFKSGETKVVGLSVDCKKPQDGTGRV